MGLLDDPIKTDPSNQLSNPLYGTGNDEIANVLSSPDTDAQTRQLAMQIQGMQGKLSQLGYDPSVTEPRHSFFGDLLDTLDAPRQGIAGIIDTALRGDMFQNDPKTGQNVGTGFMRGQEENTTTSDIFRRHDIIDNPILRGALGFAGDILTDPLTYLTFGAGSAAKVGGKVLTESGVALRDLASSRLLGGATDAIDIVKHSEDVDNVFKGIAQYQDAAKGFKDATSDSVRALEADRMTKAQEQFANVISPDELTGDLFKKPSLQVGINLPFLGHVLPEEGDIAKEVLVKDPGPVGQALRLAGKVWKPGRVNIADFQLTDGVVNAFDNLRLYANDALGKVGQGLASLEAIPGVGSAVTGAKAVGEKASDVFQTTNKLLKKIFYQKALIGDAANNNRLDYLSLKAAAPIVSRERVVDQMGEEFLKDLPLQKEVYLAIDGQAMGAMKAIGDNKDVLDTINKIRTAQKVSEGDQLLFRDLAAKSGAEQDFRSRIDNIMLDPNVDQKVKAGVQSTMKYLDDLAIQDGISDLGYSRLEYYVPHKYLNVDNHSPNILSGGGKPTSFLKERKYNTIADAFAESGKVGDTDLASLLQYRTEKSLVLGAQRQFAKRLMLEEGLNPALVQNMYREALTNPGGAASKALKKFRIDMPSVNVDAMKNAAVTAEREKVYAGVGLKDPEASRLVALNASDFEQKVHEELWNNGMKPLDSLVPREALGELGEKITVPGSPNESFFLPKPIADAYHETTAAKDILKSTLGQSPFGRATINSLDHGISFFKKFATLPWPSYWIKNFIGDRFNQAMGGVHAMDPGIFARTYSVLKGDSAIRSANGMFLDRGALENVIKQFGLNYSVGDFLGTTDAFGEMNIDKFLATKNSLWQNVKEGLPGIPFMGDRNKSQAALAQLHDKFQKGFDGFQRVSQFVHRFEKGDSIADAARGANDMYFNYRDLSPVEQSLFRRFYMFYGYMSKATKQTMTSLVTQPGNLTMQLHGVNALAELFSDPNAAPTAEQHDANLLNSVVDNEQISRVVGKTPEGKPIVARAFGAPIESLMQQFSVQTPRNFSVQELLSAASDSAGRTIQKQFATANPVINAAAQQVSGKNLYFDKPLDSAFLRKLPSLNAAAEKLAGIPHDQLPIDLDAPLRRFLKAVPDGKGRLIADPSRMWILTNLIPGMSRAVSMGGTLTNADIPTSRALLRTLVGVNLEDADISRSYLYSKKDELQKIMNSDSVNQQIKNNANQGLGE